MPQATMTVQDPTPDWPAIWLLTIVSTLSILMLSAWMMPLLFELDPVRLWVTAAHGLAPALSHLMPSGYQPYQTLPSNYNIILLFTAIITIFAFIISMVFYIKQNTPQSIIHVRGRQLVQGHAALRQAAKRHKQERRWGGDGLELAPGLQISEDRETRGMLVVGSPGSGKTTIIRPLIEAARARGDKCLIFDNKSDYTKTFAGPDDVMLVAPWDSRGAAWNIAADIRNKADAVEFAVALIPVAGNDPMWSQAAQQILVGIIRQCQVQKPGRWGFLDLVDVIAGGGGAMQAAVRQHHPEASLLIADLQSKTTASIFVNLISFFSPLFTLADAWGRCPTSDSFSLSEWLADDYRGKTTIVLQGNGRYSSLQRSLTQAVVSTLTREMNSPAIPDAKPWERRIWLFLDEFPQLGKLSNFQQFLEVGRSKGIRTLIGAQDVAQIRALYSSDEMEIWTSVVGTYILCRTQGVETPVWLSDLVGQQVVKRYSPSFSSPTYATGEAPTRTDQYIQLEQPAMPPEAFASRLGADKTGVTALLLDGGDQVYKLKWPHLTSDLTGPVRPAQEPARWTAPDYPSVADQMAGLAAQVPAAGVPAEGQAVIKGEAVTGGGGRKQDTQGTPVLEPHSPPSREAEVGEDATEELVKEAGEHLAHEMLALHGNPITAACKVVEAVYQMSATQAMPSAPVRMLQPQSWRDEDDKRRRQAQGEQEMV